LVHGENILLWADSVLHMHWLAPSHSTSSHLGLPHHPLPWPLPALPHFRRAPHSLHAIPPSLPLPTTSVSNTQITKTGCSRLWCPERAPSLLGCPLLMFYNNCTCLQPDLRLMSRFGWNACSLVKVAVFRHLIGDILVTYYSLVLLYNNAWKEASEKTRNNSIKDGWLPTQPLKIWAKLGTWPPLQAMEKTTT
jgi:hypothetical protein